MTRQRPFRFGALVHNTSPSKNELIDQARKAEQQGRVKMMDADLHPAQSLSYGIPGALGSFL
jgi:hypothetical protein